MKESELFLSLKVNEESTEQVFKTALTVFALVGILLSLVSAATIVLFIIFLPHQYSDNSFLVHAFLVRGLMSYGVFPLVLSLLQLLIRCYYHPKLFIISYILWIGALGSAIGLSIADFHIYMDIICASIMGIFVILQGVIVGKKYRRLMLEEEAAKLCSASVFTANN